MPECMLMLTDAPDPADVDAHLHRRRHAKRIYPYVIGLLIREEVVLKPSFIPDSLSPLGPYRVGMRRASLPESWARTSEPENVSPNATSATSLPSRTSRPFPTCNGRSASSGWAVRPVADPRGYRIATGPLTAGEGAAARAPVV